MSEADEDVLRALDVDSLIELIAALRRDYALVVDERDTYRDNAMPEAATIMNTLSAERRQLQDRLSEVEAERDRLRADQMVTAEQEVVIVGLRKKLATIVAERDRLRAVVDVADDFWPLIEQVYDQALATWEYGDERMKYVTVQISKVDLPTLRAAYAPRQPDEDEATGE